jgi:hypothetical protein
MGWSAGRQDSREGPAEKFPATRVIFLTFFFIGILRLRSQHFDFFDFRIFLRYTKHAWPAAAAATVHENDALELGRAVEAAADCLSRLRGLGPDPTSPLLRVP